MTEQTPDQIAAQQAEMIKSIEGMVLVECPLDRAIDAVIERFDTAEPWRAVVLFTGDDAEWEEERERTLMFYSTNSIEELKRQITGPNVSLTIARTAREHTLHAQLADLRQVMTERGVANYTVYVCHKPGAGELVNHHSFIHPDVTFDFVHAPHATELNAFRLALKASAAGTNIPVDYVYRLVDRVPVEGGFKHLPANLFYIEVNDGGKVYEVVINDADHWVAWDLLMMYLAATSELPLPEFLDSIRVVSLHNASLLNRKPFLSEFISERFRGLVEVYRELYANLAAADLPVEFKSDIGGQPVFWELKKSTELVNSFWLELKSRGDQHVGLRFHYQTVNDADKGYQVPHDCIRYHVDGPMAWEWQLPKEDVPARGFGPRHELVALGWDVLSLFLRDAGWIGDATWVRATGLGWIQMVKLDRNDTNELQWASVQMRTYKGVASE